MNLSEELERVHQHMYTTLGLSVPANDWDSRKQQVFNSTNKLIDPAINQQIVDILQEQMKQLRQSLDHVCAHMKQQSAKDSATSETTAPAANELPNDTKELQDQVSTYWPVSWKVMTFPSSFIIERMMTHANLSTMSRWTLSVSI